MAQSYDFIVVGAGPAGCAVARRLADTKKKPSVLLVEAGSDNRIHQHYRSHEARFSLAFTQPDLDWKYSTTEQPHLNNRRINHARGRGLGGSTQTNFSCWVVGADKDYDDWADLTGDDAWKWSAVWERLKKIENVHQDVAPEHRPYLEPFTHSTTGNVDLTFSKVWDQNMEGVWYEAGKQMNWPQNNDLNSGNPIGLTISPVSYRDGLRINSAEAYLSDIPANLTILPDTAVAKILVENKRATAIIGLDGQEYHAKNDIILSGGALNTPQLLMLSGIGPAAEIQKHDIPMVHELPGVGQHLLDHFSVSITQVVTPESVAASVPAGTDPKYQLGSQFCVGFLKLPSLHDTPEVKSLPASTQARLAHPTVPHFEFGTLGVPMNLGTYTPSATDTFRSVVTFLMNLQSEGTVTLSSSSPTDPPVIDSNYLAHPYDRCLAIDALRAVHAFQSQPAFAPSTQAVVCGPASDADDDLLDHWRQYGGSVWHMSGTVKMGRHDDPDPLVCLTPDFRVRGLRALRVVDMSVAPLLPANHTQATAYLVGETAAEKIIAEYALDA